LTGPEPDGLVGLFHDTQVVLFIGQAFVLSAGMFAMSEKPSWFEPSQMSLHAHESLVVAVVVREGPDGQPEIWTRRRPEHADGRNRMYAARWEALAKPLRHGECPMQAIQEPFRDIFDIHDGNFFKVRVMGTEDEDVDIVITTVPDSQNCIDVGLYALDARVQDAAETLRVMKEANKANPSTHSALELDAALQTLVSLENQLPKKVPGYPGTHTDKMMQKCEEAYKYVHA